MALVVVFLALITAAMALAIDIGMSVVERGQIQNAADSAALAGVGELPDSYNNARSVALDYCGRHNVAPAEVNVSFPYGPARIRVRIDRSADYFFARIFGKMKGAIAVEAEAETGVAGAITGVIPIGVEKRNFAYGEVYTLKRGAGSCDLHNSPGDCSNFGPLALGGNGASIYEDNLINGYDGVIRAGDWIPTEPGDIVGPTKAGIKSRVDDGPGETYTNFAAGSKRLVYVPIINSLEVAGKNEVLTVGFAAFFIEGLSNKGEVLGRFIRYRASGETSDTAENFNLYTSRLVK